MNPFAEKLEDDGKDQFGSMFANSFGATQDIHLPAPKDIVITLECTLLEFYNGCMKKVVYERKKLLHDGKTARAQRHEMEVEIKPGFSENTTLTYTQKGNEAEGHKPSNIVIKFKQSAHPFLKRKDNDLIYTHSVTLEQAFQSEPVKIKALDGRNIIATIDEIITPQTVKIVEGEGMPIADSPTSDALRTLSGAGSLPKGKQFIRFENQFPKMISNQHRQAVIEILRKNAEENEDI